MDYIGTPYQECDCLALAQRVLNDAGIPMGEPSDPGFADHFDPIDLSAIKRMDILHFDGPNGDHVGVYMGHNQFLHTIEETGARVDRLGLWRRWIKGAYRWHS